jgi:uncharacterized linocin/CFP29 family protein
VTSYDQTTTAVRAANCTARRFLEVDGPYGMGLSSVTGDDGWLAPDAQGAGYKNWNVTRPPERHDGAEPDRVGPGTYLVQATARPVPLIASEFVLGIRAIAAYESQCQPLDLCAVTRAARDVALEEERLIYYGYPGDPEALLRIVPIPNPPDPAAPDNVTPITGDVIGSLHSAIQELARRGYAGPFALAVDPQLYVRLYSPNAAQDVVLLDLLRSLFREGVYMAPVIAPAHDLDGRRRRCGAIVTAGRAYSRLIVGQDWHTAYRGRDGILQRFLLLDSLQLRVCDHLSIQVLIEGEPDGGRRSRPAQ